VESTSDLREGTIRPKVSVILPVYKMEEYVGKAIESILTQTFRDFELIIISEYGNTPASEKVIDSFSDERIRVVKNKERLGLERSLNLAIELSRGEYVANMNADDISFPARLEKQVDFLEKNPDVGVLGSTTYAYYESSGKRILTRPETLPDAVSWLLLFNSALAAPSVMIRRKILTEIGFFDPNHKYCEDYDFWARASHITKLANLSEPLIEYRIHPTSITFENSEAQQVNAMAVALREESRLLGRQVDREIARTYLIPSKRPPPESMMKGVELLIELERGFSKGVGNEAAKSRIRGDLMRRLMHLTALSTFKSPMIAMRMFLRSIESYPDQVRGAIIQYFKHTSNALFWTRF
jgi:glycosyltransferase involved in cell wall biosynthesis